VELDIDIALTWIDWEIWNFLLKDPQQRVDFIRRREEIILDPKFLKDIWKPDIFIGKMDLARNS